MRLNIFLFKKKKLVFQKIKKSTYYLTPKIFISTPESKELKINLSALKMSLSRRRKKKKNKNKKLFPFLRTNFQKIIKKKKKKKIFPFSKFKLTLQNLIDSLTFNDSSVTLRLFVKSFFNSLKNPKIIFKKIIKKYYLLAFVSMCLHLENLQSNIFTSKSWSLRKQIIKDRQIPKPIIKIIKEPRPKKVNLLPIITKVKKQKLFYFFFLSIFGRKIISYFIKKGKKQQAEKLVYTMLTELLILIRKNKKKQFKVITIAQSLLILKRALIFLMPFYEMRSYRIKGQTNTTLLPLYNKRRRVFLIFKLMQNFLKNQKKPYAKRIAETLYATSQKEGPLYSLFLKNLKDQRKEYPKVHFRWVR